MKTPERISGITGWRWKRCKALSLSCTDWSKEDHATLYTNTVLLINILFLIKYPSVVRVFSLGDLSAVEPPDSIPNSEVKRCSADDSYWATGRENKSSPRLSILIKENLELNRDFFGFTGCYSLRLASYDVSRRQD